MRKIWITSIALVLLSGCESAESPLGDLGNLGQSASGAIHEATDTVNDFVEMGKTFTDGVTEMVEDAKKRINQVQSGVNLIMEGKDLIETGVSGDE